MAATPAQRGTGARKTKVAVLIGALDVGGAELDIVRNFPRLNRDEFEVVVVLFCNPGPLAPQLEQQDIRVIARRPDPVAAPGTSAPVSAATKARRRMKKIPLLAPLVWLGQRIFALLYAMRVTAWVGSTFRSERVDIAHCFLPHSYAYGMVACALWRPRAKTVMSRLSLNFYKEDQPLLAWLERNWLHRRLDTAVCNSRLIVDELIEEGVPRERVALLYNGIDLNPFERGVGDRERARAELSLHPDSFVVLAVGNLHTYKGHEDLIRAVAELSDRLPLNWKVLIAGRDQEGNRARYEALVQSLGLGEHVALLGPRDDVDRLLLAADVFVQPSHHEGLPNAIVEAMAASLPVIGTRVGGIPEVVTGSGEDDARTGWLVDAGDVDALAAVLLEAAADPGIREKLGRNGRLKAESQFSIERSVRDYEAIYRRLVSRDGLSEL